jgi:hypothetical protein
VRPLYYPVASRDRVTSLPPRVLPYTGFIFRQARFDTRIDSLYILYIYTIAPNRIRLHVDIFWLIRVSRSRKSILTRVLPYTKFTFDTPEVLLYIYNIYISNQVREYIRLQSRRFSRSGKITFNTCFTVYRIHFRRARLQVFFSITSAHSFGGHSTNLLLVPNLLLFNHDYSILYIYTPFF